MADSTSSDQNKTPEQKAEAPVVASKSSNKTLIIILIVVAVLFVIPGLIFGGALFWISRGDNAENLTENIIESASGSANVDINTEDKSFTIETEEGSVSAQSGESLPDDFPDVVVLYDDQNITGTFNQSSDTQQSWSVAAETDATLDQVGGFFESSYSDWESAGTYSTESLKSYTYSKDGLSVYIAVTKNEGDDKTAINYTINKEL